MGIHHLLILNMIYFRFILVYNNGGLFSTIRFMVYNGMGGVWGYCLCMVEFAGTLAKNFIFFLILCYKVLYLWDKK